MLRHKILHQNSSEMEQLNYKETAEFQIFAEDYHPSEVNTQTE